MASKPLVIATLACALGTACGGAEPTAAGQPETTSGASRAAEREVALTPTDANPAAEPCTLRTVFFEFDSHMLDDSSRDEIQRAVRCFRERGVPARLHLTGATDPRGTEEYNIALGDRRAQAVRQYLTGLGVDAGRVTVSSVGEEMASGSDDASWSRDRNVSATEVNE